MIPILAVLALGLLSALAEPVTSNRVSALPAGEQSAWDAYQERSRTRALADQAAVQAEVAALKITNALKAPSGGDFKLNRPAGDAWYAGDEAGQLADAILPDALGRLVQAPRVQPGAAPAWHAVDGPE